MQPYAKIITGGLGAPACRGLLTADFSLAGCTFEVHVGGGGPYPGPAINKLSPGEIHNFFKPINPESTDWLVKKDFPAGDYKQVTIKMTLRNKEYHYDTLVSKETAKDVITISKIATKIRDDIKIAVNTIEHQINKATISVKNFLRKDK